MLLGYARVSTAEQDVSSQVNALRRAGVRKIVEEWRSGAEERPELEKLLNRLKPGDTLVVYKVDRLARSLRDLLRVLDLVSARGAIFKSLTEPIETGTPAGVMLVQLLGAFAQFERAIIRERCEAGRVAAVGRGVRFGRPPKLDRAEVLRLVGAGHSQSDIARRFECHPSSVNRLLRPRASKAA